MEDETEEQSSDPLGDRFTASVTNATTEFIQKRVGTVLSPRDFHLLHAELIEFLVDRFGPVLVDPDSVEYSAASHLARDVGVIHLFNHLNLADFVKVPVAERAIFLPHCLTAGKKCAAEEHDRYSTCVRCGACSIADLLGNAYELGYSPDKVFIVSGGSVIPSLVRRFSIRALVGIACFNELYAYLEAFGGAGLPPSQMVMLSRWGCRNTRYDKGHCSRVFDSIRDAEEALGGKCPSS